MKGDDPGNDSGFKVVDKRRFDSDGAVRPDTLEDEERDEVEPVTPGHEPHINAPAFGSFVKSLLLTGLVQAGAVHAKEFAGHEPDEAGAKNTLDVLLILCDKTKGNLTTEEDRLLTELLYDLRLKYVSICKSS